MAIREPGAAPAVAGPAPGASVVLPAPLIAGLGQGVVIGPPTVLSDEPRDLDLLQVAVAILLLLELAVVMYYVSRIVLIVLAVVVVLSLLSAAFRGVVHSSGCLSFLLRIPIQVIGAAMRPIAGVFDPGRDPRNMRQVREYRLNLSAGSQDVFVVKGNLDRCTLDAQDEVRVYVTHRQGRPYLQRGELLDKSTGAWLPLHVSEPPLGMYWLLGFLVITAILLYLGLTLQLWRVPR